MADPFSWAMIATAATAGNELIGGIQGYQQNMYEADVAGQNARIATDNAGRARLDASLAEEAQRREARKTMGRAWAASAQSGAAGSGPGQGSFGALNTQSAQEAELDALNLRYGGEMEAFADLTQAAQFNAERRAARQRARGAIVTGVLGAAAAGLSGVADYRRNHQARPTTQRAPGPSSKGKGSAARVPIYNYGSY